MNDVRVYEGTNVPGLSFRRLVAVQIRIRNPKFAMSMIPHSGIGYPLGVPKLDGRSSLLAS